jgi:hypothetical protein
MTEHPDTELKFAPEPETTLRLAASLGRLAATIRYDDEKGIQTDDQLLLTRADSGEEIGEASVEHVLSVPVHEALNAVWLYGAEYGINSIGGLLSALDEYYDDNINAETTVKVLILKPNVYWPDEGSSGSIYNH